MTRVARKESATLRAARRALANAESECLKPTGLEQLEQGLALVDDVCASDAESSVAENLVASYTVSICTRIGELIAADPHLPEPALEHCFKLLLAFDHCRAGLPANARELKLEIVRRLIDRYYEGHSDAAKQRALEQLTAIAHE